MAKQKGKKKKQTGGVSAKSVYIANLVQKGNWPQVKKEAAAGVPEAVEAINKRQTAKTKNVVTATK